jgi:hypothetical protein
MVECVNHSLAQLISVSDLAKGDGILSGSWNTGVVCDPADRHDQNVVCQGIGPSLEFD